MTVGTNNGNKKQITKALRGAKQKNKTERQVEKRKERKKEGNQRFT